MVKPGSTASRGPAPTRAGTSSFQRLLASAASGRTRARGEVVAISRENRAPRWQWLEYPGHGGCL